MQTPTTILIFLYTFALSTLSIQANDTDSLKLLMQQYRYQEVVDMIDSNDHDNISLLNLKSVALKALNKHIEAVSCLELVLVQDSSNIKTLVDLADSYQSIFNYKKARELLTLAYKINPENNYILQQLANACYQDNAFKDAKDYYVIAWQSDSTNHIARQLAKSYEQLDLKDSAIIYYTKVIKDTPRDFQSAFRLATLHRAMNQLDEGIHVTNVYLKQDSANFRMARLSGILYYMINNHEDAALRFEQCLSINDTSIVINRYLGYCYFRLDKYELAKKHLEFVFSKNPDNSEISYALAHCSLNIEDYDDAEFYLDTTLELITPQPTFLSQIYITMANTYTANNKNRSALQAWFKALNNSPDDLSIVYSIARHYDLYLDEKKNAVTFYEKFLVSRPALNSEQNPNPIRNNLNNSYYDYVERRVTELKQQSFWEQAN
jgi:tetratricopeptide (TPR) repeat protein